MGSFSKQYGLPTIATFISGSLMLFQDILVRPFILFARINPKVCSKYLISLFVLCLVWLITRYVRYSVIQSFMAKRADKQMPKLLEDIAAFIILLLGVIIIFSQVFNKDISTILATGGIGIFIIGFALKEVISSVFNGLIINLEKPFNIGDFILLDKDLEGYVREVNWRTTRIQKKNGTLVIVPNNTIANAKIINFHYPTTINRESVQLYIDYDTSIDSAERLLLAAALNTPCILQDPKPKVIAKEIDRNGLLYEVQFWIDYAHIQKDGAIHAVIKSILERLRECGIDIPYPKTESLNVTQPKHIADRSLDRYYLISQVDLFHTFPEEVRHLIADGTEEKYYAAGVVIGKKSASGHTFYIVGEGLVKNCRYDLNSYAPVQERFVSTEYFGELSVLTGSLMESTYVAEVNSVIYQIDWTILKAVFEKSPASMEVVARVLADRKLKAQIGRDEVVDAHPEARLRNYQLFLGQIRGFYQAPEKDHRAG